jgi:glucan 1,3-beta-glucosidase
MIILAEHHVLYQYMLKGAKNHYMGLIQTETVSTRGMNIAGEDLTCMQAYFQPNPPSPWPHQYSRTYQDPITDKLSGWGLWVEHSHKILIFGA